METKQATIAEVCKFFGGSLAKIRAEWNELTDEDKVQLRTGIGNGTLTY